MISIILPVFNGERYLRESVDSVLAQNYQDFELVVWDDGSADNTARILADYGDPRMRVFRNNANQGLFKTLNSAITQARGDFIRLWSYDDIMKQDCLQIESDFNNRHPQIGMSYCGRDIIDESGEVIVPWPDDKTPEIISSELAAQIMFYHGSIAGNISTVTVKKEIFREIGFFREDMLQSSDFYMWARISAKYPIGFIGKPLIYLRRHGMQFSRWKGMGVVFIKEDREVIHDLVERLPPDIKAYARVYNRWHRYIPYVHYMLNSLARADIYTAIEVHREIRKDENFFLLIWLWLISGGGRWFKKRPKYG